MKLAVIPGGGQGKRGNAEGLLPRPAAFIDRETRG